MSDSEDKPVGRPDENPMNLNPKGKGGFQDHPELINREGRPKKGQTWRELLEKIGRTVEPAQKKSYKFLVPERLWIECLKGNISAMQVLFNRMDDPPRRKTEEVPADTNVDKVAELLDEMYARLHESDINSKNSY